MVLRRIHGGNDMPSKNLIESSVRDYLGDTP
jgi:hypothetical protein